MRNWIDIITENVGKTVLITDLYSTRQLSNEREAICDYAPPVDWDKPLVVRQMTASVAAGLQSGSGTDVMDTFETNSTQAQKRIVEKKMKNFDESRIVVLCGQDIVDGNHQVVAAVKLGKPVLYVDLSDWD